MGEKPISFDRVADIYDVTRNLPADTMARLVDKLASTLLQDDCYNILDAGVGTGRFAAPLQKHGLNLVGVDISRMMLSHAKVKGVNDLVRASICSLPFRNKTFDAALSIHVLHLVREWKMALGELHRVLRKELVSVVSIFPDQSQSLIDIYEGMLIDAGWKEIHPGLRERELPSILPPSRTEHVVTLREEQAAEHVIGLLEKRVYSSLWDVPEKLHKRIIARLRKEYDGKRVKSKREIYIYVWDVQKDTFPLTPQLF